MVISLTPRATAASAMVTAPSSRRRSPSHRCRLTLILLTLSLLTDLFVCVKILMF
jgi:hypothetical protein